MSQKITESDPKDFGDMEDGQLSPSEQSIPEKPPNPNDFGDMKNGRLDGPDIWGQIDALGRLQVEYPPTE